jgi:hypothetical protein
MTAQHSAESADARIPDTSVFPLEGFNGKLSGGLTRRELFAAMAMQGIFAHGYTMPNESAEAADYAVRAADCLLKELSK